MRTTPDYGHVPESITSPNVDNAEVAARLGYNSPRRSGRLVGQADWQTDMDGWIQTGAGISNYFGWGYTGNSCMLLDDVAIAGTSVIKNFPIINDQVGVEWIFATTGGVPSSFGLNIQAYKYQWSLLHDLIAGVWTVLSGGVYNNLPGTYISDLANPRWNNLKLVIDLENATYKRLELNNYEIDLSAYPADIVGPDVAFMSIEVYQHSHGGQHLYSDSLFYTCDEY